MDNIWKYLSPAGKRKLIFERNTGRSVRMSCGMWVAVEDRGAHLKACEDCEGYYGLEGGDGKS